ncbi:transposase (plasmid) [Cylindrospermum sp. NIES-4074]|nr:transposase [Cylindrospermum sp. NIES-4074]
MSKSYSTNLTQDQWELIEPLIPASKPGGRPREVEICSVLNAIFYVLRTYATGTKVSMRLHHKIDNRKL